MTISTVIFDFGGVISSPLFVGIGAFEEAEGYPKGSLLRLLFGDTSYIGVEGRAVADAVAADPDAAEQQGEVEDEPDWHLLEKGQLDMATYFERMVEKAPRVIGMPIDMEAYGRFWRQTAPGVHWTVVHKMRDLKTRGLRIGLLTNNVKEFGDNWRAMFPIDELCDEVVDSSHVGMRKPDREIYELTCAAHEHRAERSRVPRRQRRQRRRGTRSRHGSRARGRSRGRARRARVDPHAARHAV